MKKLYLIQLLLFISVVAHAQPYETNPDFNRTRNWHFGQRAGLHFSSDTIIFTSSEIDIAETSAVHTDSNGTLLLYSNGEKIWDANHKIIHNGNLSLGHYSSRQGSIFVIHEDSPNYIYLFNSNFSGSSNRQLTFNLIIHEADTFRVVFKDSVIQINMSEPIAVVKADNGRDIWIITHVFDGSNFVAYRLTQEGLIFCPVISNSKSYAGGGFQGAQFAMKTSLDGKYILKSNTSLPTIVNSVEIYTFNNSNGKITPLFTIDSLMRPIHGLNFSKYNNIYVIERDMHINVFSFYPEDSLKTVQSKKQLQVEGYQYHEMFKYEIQNLTYTNQLALTILDSTYLALLNDHELVDSVSIISKGIYLEGSPTSLGLPNFNQSYFYNPSINFSIKLNCITNTIQFYGKDTFSATSHDWLITKQGTNPMTATIKAPLIAFEDTGVYSVRYIASNGGRSDTLTKEVIILPKINSDFLGNDTGWCNVVGTPIILQAPSGMHCYEWNTGETNSQISANTAGIYIAKITTPNFCVIYDTVIISVDTVETFTSNFLGEDIFWCENLDTLVKLNAPNGFLKYLWSNGSKEQEILISVEGVYFVEAFKRNQCTSGGDFFAYDTIEVILLNAPPKPILDRMDDSLFTNISGNYTYEWYRNNTILSDTTKYLILPDTGHYFLKVTNLNDCNNYSDTVHVAILGIESPLFSQIKLYPNPSNGVFGVEILNGEYSFAIKDITGKVQNKGKLKLGVNQLDISHLSDGIYLITIKNNQNSITYKIIKQTE